MKKANKALLVALLGAGLVLASCGGTETSSSTPAESTTTSASSEAEASSETHGESSSESVSLPDSSDTSSTPDVVEDYLVDIVETTGVHITSNLERAKPGDTVTLTVTVDPGYVLTSLTMNGEALTAATDGTYSFTMPDRDATIRATTAMGPGRPTMSKSRRPAARFTSGSAPKAEPPTFSAIAISTSTSASGTSPTTIPPTPTSARWPKTSASR